MTNKDFWESIDKIIGEGFSPDGLKTLEIYANKFIAGQLVYQRFSSFEQHGCSKGGALNVIASLLAGAEIATDRLTAPEGSFKREQQRAETQIKRIECWAHNYGCWFDLIDEKLDSLLGAQIAEGGEAHVYDHGDCVVKYIGLDYFVQPVFALDRISLHNAFFPETRLKVIGFGKTKENNFQILVEQPFIIGVGAKETEITGFVEQLGFKLINPSNWTYANNDIYLSDLHDENVLVSAENHVYVIDCDIRLNTPDLKCGGNRIVNNGVTFIE